jgi:hypothetical protein
MRVLVLLLLTAAPLLAQPRPVDLKVGMEAPNFRARGDLINPPHGVRELADCKGDVVLIMEWNIRDGSADRLPDIQRYFERHGGNGLTILTIHRLDFENLAQVRRYLQRKGYTFPVAMGGITDDRNDFFRYRADRGFRTTIIGIDGLIAYHDTGDKFQEALDRELGRVNYPHLGKHEVAREAERTARRLARQEFGEALQDARRTLELEISDEARADLELLIERVLAIGEARMKLVEEWKEQRRWDLARDMLDRTRREFKGHEIGAEAQRQFDAIRREQRAELRAFDSLQRSLDRFQPQEDGPYMNELRRFINANQGTGAAEYATELLSQVEAAQKD